MPSAPPIPWMRNPVDSLGIFANGQNDKQRAFIRSDSQESTTNAAADFWILRCAQADDLDNFAVRSAFFAGSYVGDFAESGPMSTSASTPRASAWEWAQTALLAVNVAWTTLCLGGYRPETMVVTTWLTGLLLLVHGVGFALKPWRVHPASWWLLPFLVYALANVLWVTPLPWLGWFDWFLWAEMIAVFWVTLNGLHGTAPRRALYVSLVSVAVVAAGMAFFQRFVEPGWLMLGRVQAPQYRWQVSGPFGIPNSLAGFLILLLPSLGLLGFRRESGAFERNAARVAFGLCALALVLTVSRGGIIGLALALTLASLLTPGVGGWRRIGRAVAIFAVIALAGTLLITVVPNVRERFADLIKYSGERSRPYMWHAAWELFRSHPLFGTGAGSYNILFERHRPERFPDETQWAHNDYLNTLSDYGLAGFVLFYGAVLMIGLKVWRRARTGPEDSGEIAFRDPAFARALGVGLLAFAFQLCFDFHLKIPALGMSASVCAALAVGLLWPARRLKLARAGGRKLALVAGSVMAMAACGWLIARQYRAEALRYAARGAINQLAARPPDPREYRRTLENAVQELAQAVTWAPRNAQAWSDLAYALSLQALGEPARTAELGKEAEAAADRALTISTANAEFWIRRGVARDMSGKWLEAGNDFTKATVIASRNALAWFYYADHMSRRPEQKYLTQAALDFCLRLDPGNPAGLALRQRLAISQKAP